ncbi:MAG: hypothetical protein BWY65_02422 [Firmicutes bacterium ADurb.Bin373]|nr:MAG: hypothetical protein BWY65_02422 [Firmicutes bacterium ADurb.Bin373]
MSMPAQDCVNNATGAPQLPGDIKNGARGVVILAPIVDQSYNDLCAFSPGLPGHPFQIAGYISEIVILNQVRQYYCRRSLGNGADEGDLHTVSFNNFVWFEH